jgi:leucyl/phenylalanyl-tRNA--protein transferase
MSKISPQLVLQAYCSGAFPMAHPEDENQIYWHAPDPRAILPFDEFHVPTNLARLVRQKPFTVTTDCAFERVIHACAERTSTWISRDIIRIYTELHERGFAHSVECWAEEQIVGGLYGVAVRGAFFGESMFYRTSNASKVALVHLFDMLHRGGFLLHDIQFLSSHMEQFGAVEISREQFLNRLDRALATAAAWPAPPDLPGVVEKQTC